MKCRLKEIRMKEYMMNLTQFAEMIGYDISTVSGWEREMVKPTLDRALDISYKLKKNVNDIWHLE